MVQNEKQAVVWAVRRSARRFRRESAPVQGLGHDLSSQWHDLARLSLNYIMSDTLRRVSSYLAKKTLVVERNKQCAEGAGLVDR
jgi:hypothetical protein